MFIFDEAGNLRAGKYKTSATLLTAEEIQNAPDDLPQHIKDAGWELVEVDGKWDNKNDRRGVPVGYTYEDRRVPIAFLVKLDKSHICNIGTPMSPAPERCPKQMELIK